MLQDILKTYMNVWLSYEVKVSLFVSGCFSFHALSLLSFIPGDVVFGYCMHTSLTTLNGSHPGVSHVSPPFAPV